MAAQWTDERVALLRDLWPTTVSTADIARRCDTTTSAVISKARRLRLEDRGTCPTGGPRLPLPPSLANLPPLPSQM